MRINIVGWDNAAVAMEGQSKFEPMVSRTAERIAKQPYGAVLRGLRRLEAARYIGVSASKFDELVRDGRMPHPFRVDTCTIWDVHDLDAAIDDLKHADMRNPWDGGAT